jgi:hypothetical protein
MQDRAQFPTRAGEKRIGGELTEQQSEESNCQGCDNRHSHQGKRKRADWPQRIHSSSFFARPSSHARQ